MTKMKRNASLIAMIAAIGTAGSVFAAPASSQLNLNLSSAVNITPVAGLNIGTISATRDDDAAGASFTIDAETSATSSVTDTADSKISILEAGAPADLLITNAAPKTALTVTLPVNTGLKLNGAGSDVFDLSDFEAFYYKSDFNMDVPVTDETGELGFRIGAKVTASTGAAAANTPVPNGVYTADLTVTVAY